MDEVLAVGDLFFRQKCYARLEELLARDTTILFVSHQMEAVWQYCDHVISLDKGQAVYQGNAQEARDNDTANHGNERQIWTSQIGADTGRG